MTGLDRDTSKSPDRTGVCCTGRCAPSQCETITGPSFSSLNKPDQERTPAYRDSSGSESPSGCLLCYFVRRLGAAIWGIPDQSGERVPLLNGPTEFGSHHPTPVQFTTDACKLAMPGDLLFCGRGSTTGRMNWADQEYAIGRGVAAIRHRTTRQLQPLMLGIVEIHATFTTAIRDRFHISKCIRTATSQPSSP